MIGALRYELFRIRTVGSTYWLLGLGVGLTALISLIFSLSVVAVGLEDIDLAEVTTWGLTSGASGPITPVVAAVFYIVVGALTAGHEYRYGTNKATLTAIPDRVAVLTAKGVVLATWVLGAVVLTVLINLLITSVFLGAPTIDSDTWRSLLEYLGYCIGFAWAGYGLALIFRHQVGAIVLGLAWPLAIEPIINGVLTAAAATTGEKLYGQITNFLPASAGRRLMFDPYEGAVAFGTDVDVWGIGASTAVFWVGVLICVVGGSILFLVRDA